MGVRYLSLALAVAAPACSSIIYATSYNDHSLNVLSLNGSSLSVIAKSYDCGSEPTWLQPNFGDSALYCLNEGWGGNASITSYQTYPNGSVRANQVLPVLKSPVASALFDTYSSHRMFVAFYDTSTFGHFGVRDRSLTVYSNQTYTLSTPGPVPDRQAAPHPHHVIRGPGWRYITVTDLGADLIRIYEPRIQSGEVITAVDTLTPIKVTPGSGPRHGAYADLGNNTYFYTVNELSNTITGYNVTYKELPAPKFAEIFTIGTHGPGTGVPNGTKGAEIVVSPDQRFVIVSSRGDNPIAMTNWDFNNSGLISSDPLMIFSIDAQTGNLTLIQTYPAGGRNPRHFSLNKDGTLLVSALQDDNRVVVIERDVKTGKLGKILAHTTVGEGPNNGPSFAMFYE